MTLGGPKGSDPFRFLQALGASSALIIPRAIVRDLYGPVESARIQSHLSTRNLNESWHDLVQLKERAQNMFELGLLDLDVKARVETLFWEIAEEIQSKTSTMDPEEVPEDLSQISTELASTVTRERDATSSA